MTQFPVRYTWLHHQPTVPLSSVLHTPTQTGTHARTHTHTSPSSAVTLPEQPSSFPPTATQSSPEKENGIPCERVSLLRWGDLLFTLHYSDLPGALVVCGIWQLPSSLYRIRWGKHHPLDTLKIKKTKRFSSHRGWCWLEDWMFVSERCTVLGQSLCYGSVSWLRARLAAAACLACEAIVFHLICLGRLQWLLNDL